MSKYWKLTKARRKRVHRQARMLKKYKDRVKKPYALATWQVKKGYKLKK